MEFKVSFYSSFYFKAKCLLVSGKKMQKIFYEIIFVIFSISGLTTCLIIRFCDNVSNFLILSLICFQFFRLFIEYLRKCVSRYERHYFDFCDVSLKKFFLISNLIRVIKVYTLLLLFFLRFQYNIYFNAEIFNFMCFFFGIE